MRSLSLLLVISLGFAGCSIFQEEERTELSIAQGLWSRAEISDYSYQLTVVCFCDDGRFNVTVQDGALASVEPLDGQESTTLAEKTIPDLFNVIVEAVSGNASVVDVDYHGAFGYPNSIYIDYIEEAVDDEIRYEIDEFERLN